MNLTCQLGDGSGRYPASRTDGGSRLLSACPVVLLKASAAQQNALDTAEHLDQHIPLREDDLAADAALSEEASRDIDSGER